LIEKADQSQPRAKLFDFDMADAMKALRSPERFGRASDPARWEKMINQNNSRALRSEAIITLATARPTDCRPKLVPTSRPGEARKRRALASGARSRPSYLKSAAEAAGKKGASTATVGTNFCGNPGWEPRR